MDGAGNEHVKKKKENKKKKKNKHLACLIAGVQSHKPKPFPGAKDRRPPFFVGGLPWEANTRVVAAMKSGGMIALRTTLRGRSAVAAGTPLANHSRPASTSTACTHLTSRQQPLVRQPRRAHPRASTTSSSLSATSGGSRATAGVGCGSVRSNHAAGALHYAQHQQGAPHSTAFGSVTPGPGSLPDLHARIAQLLTARTQFSLDTTVSQLSSFSAAMDSGKTLVAAASKNGVASPSPSSSPSSSSSSPSSSRRSSEGVDRSSAGSAGGGFDFGVQAVQAAAEKYWTETLPAPAEKKIRSLTKNYIRKKKLLTWKESQNQLYICMQNFARVGRWGQVVDVFEKMSERFSKDELDIKAYVPVSLYCCVWLAVGSFGCITLRTAAWAGVFAILHFAWCLVLFDVRF